MSLADNMEVKMRYVGVYLPADGILPEDKIKFHETEENAWAHIRDNHLCSFCLESLTPGGRVHPEGSVERNDHIWRTPCGAEWSVMTEEEWSSYQDECEDDDECEEIVSCPMGSREVVRIEVVQEGMVVMVVAKGDDWGYDDVVLAREVAGVEDELAGIRERFLDALESFHERLGAR